MSLNSRACRLAGALALSFCAFAGEAAASKIVVNEFFRNGNFGTGASGTDEWAEVVLLETLTADELNGYFVGDSTGTPNAKFSGYRFANMGDIATSFPAGTVIVVAGTAGPAADSTFNPLTGDWNLVLKTSGTNIVGNGSTGDLAGTDVVYVDTNGTNGNNSLSTDGHAVKWGTGTGTFGNAASVTIAALNNNAGANNSAALADVNTPGNWTVNVALTSTTPGQPNGGANSTSIAALRLAALPPLVSINDVALAEGNSGTTAFDFTVTLNKAASAAFTVDYATVAGSATAGAGADFTAKQGTLSFAGTAGETKTVSIDVIGETVPEGPEAFSVVLSNLVGATDAVIGDGTGTGTINNDDVVPPALSAGDVSIIEGNENTSTLSFIVSLDAPALAGGASVSYSTANGTATADSDYVAASGTLNFAAGETQKTVDITINGDTAVEPNESFELRFDTPNGLTIADAVAVGTITADDIATISQIQGNGATSPVVGQFTLTRGIVTLRVSNGFYVQSQQADTDADPTTSEGLFVFTSSAPSPTLAVLGNLVTVSGTVAEFIPSSDPNQQPQTQLTGPSISVVSTSNPLPTPVALGTTLPDPAGSITQLEHLENMRVSVASLTVIAATDGNVSETNATANSNGRLSGVVTGVPRPFREPGLEPEDAVGRAAGVPRFDGNPERLAIDSLRAQDPAVLVRTPIDVDVGAELSNVVGVLDYSFRSWRITTDVVPGPGVAGGRAPAAVAAAGATEFSIATYNMERFFDASNDPAIGEPVLSANAFTTRLAKASLAVRDFLGTPDIVGAVEVENLTTLQALATRINDDAVGAGQPNPQYVAYLEEGNDVGGIDVGFLVKTAAVRGATPRVAVAAVTQFGKDVLLACPDGSDNLSNDRLNDRPPLLLEATITAPNGASEDVTVIVNHLRSLNGIEEETPASAGLCAGSNFASSGERVRQKRQQQAEFLAELVQARQLADATENIVLVGDFNAFEFNDGWGDLIGAIRGVPTADAATVVAGDGADLVNPDLTLLQPATPAERYGYVFNASAQNLDHVIVNAAMVTAAAPMRVEHARLNADFGEDNRGDGSIPTRLSDHDPAVAIFTGAGFGPATEIFASGFEALLVSR